MVGGGGSQVLARASSGARVVLDVKGGRESCRVVSSQGLGTRLAVSELVELVPQLAAWYATRQGVELTAAPGRPAAGP